MRSVIFFLFALLIISCSKSNNTPLIQYTVLNVDGDSSTTESKALELTVTWQSRDGCDAVDKFQESQDGNIIYLKALGHHNSGFCTMCACPKTTLYDFEAATKGIFELRFLNPDSSFISRTVIVN